jgi:predicted phosphodiesterase
MKSVTGDRDLVLDLYGETMDVLQGLSRRGAAAGKPKASAVVGGPQANDASAALAAYGDGGKEREVKALGVAPDEQTGERAVKTSYAPRNAGIALFQSAMDAYLKQTEISSVRAGRPHAMGGVGGGDPLQAFHRKGKSGPAAADIFAQFGTLDPRWVEVVIEVAKVKFKGKHAFIAHQSTTDFRFPMPEKATVAVVGDWGGGNQAAQQVAKQIRDIDPDHVIHLGDTYYAGTPDEVRDRFLKYWPGVKDAGKSFALNSNHEMYSGGYGYFDVTLPKFKQKASYFSLANDNWQFIGLDTGYDEHQLHDPQLDWLRAQIDEYPGRKTVLLSHHQLFSAYEKTDTSMLANKIKPVLDRIYGWIWGHEHLCVVYKPVSGLRAVCLGNGCFPYSLPAGQPPQVSWIDRHTSADPDYDGGHTFALLSIDGASIQIDFIDESGKRLHQEQWS